MDAVSNRNGYILSKPYQHLHGFEAFYPFSQLYVVVVTCFVTRDLETIIH